MRSLVVLLAALALALSAAACGGGSEAGAGGDAAAVVPAGAALYVSGNTDFEGDQWQAAADLVSRFPDGDKAIADLMSEFESEENVDFEQDVKPALGPEVAFVVLDFPTDGGDPAVVALTQPDDEQKLQALLEKGSDPTVSEQLEGWTLVSDQQSSIDRFKEMRSEGALADSDAFQEAMGGLEGDSLVSLYVGGEALEKAAQSDPSFEREQLDTLVPGGKIPSIGAVARAEENGARIHGQAFFADDVEGSALVSPSFDAKLPDEVPAGVLAYLSFNDLEEQFSAFRDALAQADPAFESQLGQIEGAVGVSLEEDLAPLFAGEGAVYVRQGGLIPEVTLVTTVEDEQQAVATVDDLVSGLGAFAPLAEPTRVDIEGVEAREVPIQPPFSLVYGAFDGKLVITSARSGIADLRGDRDVFADEDTFSEAKERAGLPDETTGFVYVNLEDVLPLVLGFAGGALPPEVSANTDPLQSLVAWGTADGRKATFSLFVGIE
jgi:hypothetical protein